MKIGAGTSQGGLQKGVENTLLDKYYSCYNPVYNSKQFKEERGGVCYKDAGVSRGMQGRLAAGFPEGG